MGKYKYDDTLYEDYLENIKRKELFKSIDARCYKVAVRGIEKPAQGVIANYCAHSMIPFRKLENNDLLLTRCDYQKEGKILKISVEGKASTIDWDYNL